MPLTLLKTGEWLLIKKVGGTTEVKKFLESLGFVPGTPVSVINRIGGNVIVQIKDSRIAVSHSMAEKILI